MRIICCGGRDYADKNKIREVLSEYVHLNPTIVHGNQRGADKLAGKEADRMGLEVEPFRADWGSYGRAAGPIRNTQMLKQGADLVIGFRGGTGTANLIKQARERAVPIRFIS